MHFLFTVVWNNEMLYHHCISALPQSIFQEDTGIVEEAVRIRHGQFLICRSSNHNLLGENRKTIKTHKFCYVDAGKEVVIEGYAERMAHVHVSAPDCRTNHNIKVKEGV
jgi:hypothetical protein